MNRLVALTGLPGAGKSTVTRVFTNHGFASVYFGGLVADEIKRLGKEVNEVNEREIRERLRREHGMNAFAVLSLPKIEVALMKGNVVIDDMYSWEEYLFLREKFPFLETLAVYSPPSTRYLRLAKRKVRPLSAEVARKRDFSQIENLHQGGTIAMADWTFVNVGSSKRLKNQVEKYILSYKPAL